ncbi:MAG: hypothetical protein JF617_00680, partial [Burkholderiales bacterium]|nr:hypothetical protein [Burkholderiales bacterium]
MLLPTSLRLGAGLALVTLLAACTTQQQQKTTELTLFSINDFHGNIQPAQPTPLMPRVANPATGEVKPQP